MFSELLSVHVGGFILHTTQHRAQDLFPPATPRGPAPNMTRTLHLWISVGTPPRTFRVPISPIMLFPWLYYT